MKTVGIIHLSTRLFDYFQILRSGLFEYFLLSEDLGAEPLPILSCGLSCQYESNEVVLLDSLQPYIDDALDLIEFANGPVTSVWGRSVQIWDIPNLFISSLSV